MAAANGNVWQTRFALGAIPTCAGSLHSLGRKGPLLAVLSPSALSRLNGTAPWVASYLRRDAERHATEGEHRRVSSVAIMGAAFP